MAEFTFTPDTGASKNSKPKVNTISFGDGYEQRVPNGLNNLPEVWSLSFTNRDQSEAQAIDTFLKTAGGATNFDWVPPRESVAKKFVCNEWTTKIEKATYSSVTGVTFRQVFEP